MIIINEDTMKYFEDDPVRPHIDWLSRIQGNKTALAISEDGINPDAVICCAFCNDVPKTELDLDNEGNVAVFYTVWSYKRGSGTQMVFDAVEWIKKNKPDVNRFVTLSPPTEMARKFHLRNGAFELSVNENTVNYEYEV